MVADRIAVIGGGIIGMSIAWRLAQAGFAVAVFEKGNIGGEASWAGAGMLSLGGEIEENSPEASLAIESRRLYTPFIRELEQASRRRIDYQECGAVDLAYSSEAQQALESRAARQTGIGIVSKSLTVEEVATFWPLISRKGLTAARFYPDDAIVNPRDVTRALLAACHALQVAVFENCAITFIEAANPGVVLNTAAASEHFQAAVLAAGAWSSDIPVMGVPSLPAAKPVKGHLVGYIQPDQTCSTIVRHGQTYLLQRANGLMIAGASVEDVGFDRQIRQEIASEIAAHAGFVFPHLRETTPSEIWIGFRPGSEKLQLGAWHSQHLYLSYGHFRNGILLAPITAERIVGEISANLRTRSCASS